MTLTVGTNTYVTDLEADTYFGDRLYSEEWIGATSGDQEKALLMAKRLLDQQSFIGERASSDQILAWPRSGIPNVDSATVPQAVKDAQCELALAFLRDDLTADDGTRGVRSLRAGSVSVEYDGRAPGKRLPDAAYALLEPFLSLTGGPNSVPIVL